MTALLVTAAAIVALLTAHTVVNVAFWLRRPPGPTRPSRPAGATNGAKAATDAQAAIDAVTAIEAETEAGNATEPETVAVLLPVRDEAARVAPCVRSVLAQQGVPRLRLIVLDDGSTDGTAEVVRAAAGDDRRLSLVTGAPLPPGWLGKPHACAQLAGLAGPRTGTLVFLDADVVLAPHAVASAVALLRAARVDLLSPYPRMLAGSGGERLVQPLLQWSWLTFLPLRAVERSARPSLTAAGGQFLIVDRAAYNRAGGHAAVRAQVLEDIELARAVKRSGGRVAVADGSRLASSRMYTSWGELADGYSKSLWASFSSPAGAGAVVLLLLMLYAAPPVAGLAAAAAGNPAAAVAGGCAYLLGVAGRVVTARATGGRAWPDAWAHPVSIVLFAALVLRSLLRHRRAALSWKGRPIP